MIYVIGFLKFKKKVLYNNNISRIKILLGFKCENLHNLKNKLKLESDNNEKKKSSSVNTSNSSNEDVSNSNYVVPLYGSTFMTGFTLD